MWSDLSHLNMKRCVFADIIWRRSALNPKDCRCFWCPLIFNCLSNCHPSLLSFDCLYIISFFCPPPLSSPFYLFVSLLYLHLWHLLFVLMALFSFLCSSFFILPSSPTNIPSPSCSAPVIRPLLNPRTSSAANPSPTLWCSPILWMWRKVLR